MPTNRCPEIPPSAVGLTLLLAIALAVASCGDGSGEASPQVDENAFVQMALQATCTDIRNKLYEIDQTLVLSDRAGNCPDASYSQVLYGATVDDVYCRNQDSIDGPLKRCDVIGYQSMFDVMIANLDKPDLGLGAAHSVKVLLN